MIDTLYVVVMGDPYENIFQVSGIVTGLDGIQDFMAENGCTLVNGELHAPATWEDGGTAEYSVEVWEAVESGFTFTRHLTPMSLFTGTGSGRSGSGVVQGDRPVEEQAGVDHDGPG